MRQVAWGFVIPITFEEEYKFNSETSHIVFLYLRLKHISKNLWKKVQTHSGYHFSSRHLGALSLCWSHQLCHSTASSFSEGQQHLLAHGLINWLIRRPRCKLIDWLSWGWSCLYLEPRGAKLWRSPLICHVQHTGEDEGAMKSCGFITKTQGACLEEVSAKMGACRANNGNMGTKGIRVKGTEKVVCCWQRKNGRWTTDTHKGKKRKCLVYTIPCWFIHTYIQLSWKEN